MLTMYHCYHPVSLRPNRRIAMMPDMSSQNFSYDANIFTTQPTSTSMYTTMPQNVQQLPTSQAFSMYDPMMAFDQYFPAEFQVDGPMQFQQNPDPEMEFMSNAFHDDQHHPQGGQNSRKDPGYS